MTTEEAPGWQSIDRALASVHGESEPLHFAPPVPAMVGGNDPLAGISFYRVEDPPHWHVVTYGFTELFEKESDDSDTSGYGFELTFRLARKPRERKPPPWVFNFLQNVARYVFRTGNAFAPNHHFDCRGPIELGSKTKIVAISFVRDPELEPVDSPHGRFEFLQIVGLTRDELDAISRWDTEGFLSILRERDPLLVTDLARESLLADPGIARRVKKKTLAEGSSTGATFVAHLAWERASRRTSIKIGATGVKSLRLGLALRLPFGRDFELVGRESSVALAPGKKTSLRGRGRELRVTLDEATAAELAKRVRPERGTYVAQAHPELEIVVVPSEIKDAEGNVVEVIG